MPVLNYSFLEDEKYLKAENEFQIQLLFFTHPKLRDEAIDWLNNQKQDTTNRSVEKSDRHREAGNRLFRANKNQNATEACRCYTDAIISAPFGSKELALAYANRSAAISELGFYSEAYSDCECAIENGYPDEFMEKLVTRQALCASKLKDFDKLNACVDKLNAMTLSLVFEKQKAVFENELVSLKTTKESRETESANKYIRQEILRYPRRGRYLAASKDIAEGEVILTEKAFAFVPVDELKICKNCAAQHIIPFPCYLCSKVYYCSLKCKKADELAHKFECPAYRYGFTACFGIAHLAMNVLLKGLPSIIDRLKPCKTGEEMWAIIEELSFSCDNGYPEVMSLITNFKVIQCFHPEILHAFCSCATLVTMYFWYYTSFFDQFRETTCSKQVWAEVTSAILLRHAFQLKNNASTSLDLFSMNGCDDFMPFTDVWEKPNHFKKAELHMISRVGQTYAGIFPHLSTCNHSCDPSFSPKFNGNCVSVFARHKLRKGAEIFNSYIPNFKKYPKNVRKSSLRESYDFECNCQYCYDDYDDEAYLQFYKYRCQNRICRTVFQPSMEDQDWWVKEGELPFLECPYCQYKLKLDWFWNFHKLTLYSNELGPVIEFLKLSEQFVEGYNELRGHMCETVVLKFFTSPDREKLTDSQYRAIANAINYLLEIIERKNDVKSIVYIAKATFALDMMALGKSFNFDCTKIQMSLDMLSSEMRLIFDNYISDYIGEKFYAGRLP